MDNFCRRDVRQSLARIVHSPIQAPSSASDVLSYGLFDDGLFDDGKLAWDGEAVAR
jgi:hypothetical protein